MTLSKGSDGIREVSTNVLDFAITGNKYLHHASALQASDCRNSSPGQNDLFSWVSWQQKWGISAVDTGSQEVGWSHWAVHSLKVSSLATSMDNKFSPNLKEHVFVILSAEDAKPLLRTQASLWTSLKSHLVHDSLLMLSRDGVDAVLYLRYP